MLNNIYFPVSLGFFSLLPEMVLVELATFFSLIRKRNKNVGIISTSNNMPESKENIFSGLTKGQVV